MIKYFTGSPLPSKISVYDVVEFQKCCQFMSVYSFEKQNNLSLMFFRNCCAHLALADAEFLYSAIRHI